MAKTIIIHPEKYKISVQGKIKTLYMATLRKEANADQVLRRLPGALRTANIDELFEFGNSFPFLTQQVAALGSTGPYPYIGHPVLTTEGTIVSIGLPKLKWAKGTKMLIVKN